MNSLKSISLVLFIFICSFSEPRKDTPSEDLARIINSFQEHEAYDKKIYPLGLFTREYFQSQADFATIKLEELAALDISSLSETEKISAELLKFILEDAIDFYEFERFLNPLLSDSGFHNNLTYEVRPVRN